MDAELTAQLGLIQDSIATLKDRLKQVWEAIDRDPAFRPEGSRMLISMIQQLKELLDERERLLNELRNRGRK